MNQRKIISGLFVGMIAMSVISLSFSLAWYASATALKVDPVVIEIDSDRELKISTTANKDDFTDHLETQDLRNDVGRFAPVSSVFSYAWMSRRATTPIFYDQSYYWGSAGEPDRKAAYFGYFSQEIYLSCDDDVYVTVDPQETYLKENQEYNERFADEIAADYPDLTKKEIVERLNLISKSMRFSVLVPLAEGDADNVYSYSIIDPNRETGESKPLFGGALDNRNDRNDHCYDTYHKDGETYEVVYGDVNDRDLIVYSDRLPSDKKEYTGSDNNAFDAIHKEGTHMFDYQASYANGMRFAEEQSYSKQELSDHPELISIPVSRDPNKPRKIIVSIYIEGWDKRSINSTMGASFLANLSFKILREK